MSPDDREVHLQLQDLSVVEHEGWAELELHEAYRNQTLTRQEVVYGFTLPESAVITGVWLGGPAGRHFDYRVSPRGASAQMYREQMRVQIDPALVEQLGPGQYRLRVFPIEPSRWANDGGVRDRFVEGPEVHMWLQWRTVAGPDGWPAPQLTEHRNVFWDRSSIRTVMGRSVDGARADWLPPSVPRSRVSGPRGLISHLVDEGLSVIAIPDPTSGPAGTIGPSGDRRVAIVVDTSASMRRHRTALWRAVEEAAHAARAGSDSGTDGQTDVYLTASPYRGAPPSRTSLASLDHAGIVLAGGLDPAALLAQYDVLRASDAYDAVLILTDEWPGGGTASSHTPLPTDSPLWLVHVGGQFPSAYPDDVHEALLASGGGAATSVSDALLRAAVRADPGAAAQAAGVPVSDANEVAADISDGTLWLVGPTDLMRDAADATRRGLIETDLGPLAARQALNAAMMVVGAQLKQPDVRDRMHDLAVIHDMVTPYSSMIVLVNDAQHQRLDDLETSGGRYARSEAEAITEAAADPLGAYGWASSSGHDDAARTATGPGLNLGQGAGFERAAMFALSATLLVALLGWPLWRRLVPAERPAPVTDEAAGS